MNDDSRSFDEARRGFEELLAYDREVDRCPVCDGGDFYLRKDFDPKLGLAVGGT